MTDFIRRLLFLPEQASSIAPAIDLLHFFVIGVTMLGWLGVTIAAVYFLIRYRRRPGNLQGRVVRGSRLFEGVVIVGLLSLFILWWAIGYVYYVRLKTPPANAMEVYVVGKQWMWKFTYPDGRSSVGVLTVPTGRPVKLLLTSRDVIHGFFVPAFRIKQDVIPGRYVTTWFQVDKPGTYQVMCTQYCGLEHSNMWANIVALDPADYEQWLRATQPSPEVVTKPLADNQAPEPSTRAGTGIGLAKQGREAAVQLGCFNCHTVDGRPHIGPTWKGLFGGEVELEGGQRVVADEIYLTESLMDPRARVVRGFTPVMPSFQGIVTPAQVAAILAYIKSLGLSAPEQRIPVWTGSPPEAQPK